MVKVDMSKLEENNYHLQKQVKELKGALQDTSTKMQAVPQSEGFSGHTQQQMAEYVAKAHGQESQQLVNELDQLAQGMTTLINDFKDSVDSSSQAKIDTDNLADIEQSLRQVQQLNQKTVAQANRAYKLAIEAGANCQLIDDQADHHLGETLHHVQQTKRKLLNYNQRTLPLTLKSLSNNLVIVKSNLTVNSGIKGQGKAHFQIAAFITELGRDGWNQSSLTSYEHFLNDKISHLKGSKLAQHLQHLFKQARQVGSTAFNALFRPYAQSGVSKKEASSALRIMMKYLGTNVDNGYLKLKNGFPLLNPFENELLQTLLPKVVQTAFPFTKGTKGGLANASGTLATEIHQLRYYISDSNAKYVEEIAKKLHVTPGEYLDNLSQTGQFKVGSESARAHNKKYVGKRNIKSNYNASYTHNYKLLSNFHVEFIINNQTGQLLHVDPAKTIGKSGRDLIEWQTNDLASFVNGPSYNYANQNDMNLPNLESSHFNYDYSYGNMDMPNRNEMLKNKDNSLYKTPEKEGKDKYHSVDSYSDYHRKNKGR